MKKLLEIKAYILAFVILTLMCCNQAEETEIKDFITVEITDIIEKESYTGLTIAIASDSIVFARISRDHFDNLDEITQNLKKDQKIKIKGTLYDYNQDKPNSNSIHSSILDIKEIDYLDKN